MTINEMLKEAVENIKAFMDTDLVLGTPVVNEDNEVIAIPISKMSIGFATIIAELEKKQDSNSNLPIGSIGGGANIQPIGFLVIRGKETKFVRTEVDSQWNGILENMLKYFCKR